MHTCSARHKRARSQGRHRCRVVAPHRHAQPRWLNAAEDPGAASSRIQQHKCEVSADTRPGQCCACCACHKHINTTATLIVSHGPTQSACLRCRRESRCSKNVRMGTGPCSASTTCTSTMPGVWSTTRRSGMRSSLRAARTLSSSLRTRTSSTARAIVTTLARTRRPKSSTTSNGRTRRSGSISASSLMANKRLSHDVYNANNNRNIQRTQTHRKSCPRVSHSRHVCPPPASRPRRSKLAGE